MPFYPSIKSLSSNSTSSTPSSTSFRSVSSASLSSTSKRVQFTDHANVSFFDADTTPPDALPTRRPSRLRRQPSSLRTQRLPLPSATEEDPRRPLTRPNLRRAPSTPALSSSLTRTASTSVRALLSRGPRHETSDSASPLSAPPTSQPPAAEAAPEPAGLVVDADSVRWLIEQATAAAATTTGGMSRLCARSAARDPRYAALWAAPCVDGEPEAVWVR